MSFSTAMPYGIGRKHERSAARSAAPSDCRTGKYQGGGSVNQCPSCSATTVESCRRPSRFTPSARSPTHEPPRTV